jgi:cell division protein FtsQ
MRKFLKILSGVLVFSVVLVMLGFVHHEQQALVCKGISIRIDNEFDHEFIDVEDIRKLIVNSGDSIIGQPVASIDVGHLEKLIGNHPSVAKADVYKTIDGEIQVEVRQRNPILRVFPVNGDGFYIDEEGSFMPLSNKYSAKVLVANGHIVAGNAIYSTSIPEIIKNDSLSSKTILDDLFLLAKYINEDEFRKAQIQQVYVDITREIELIPRVGNHRIIIGDVSDIEEKFNRLWIFYTKGLSKTGWNEYETINLKYKNQIVCTKI